MQTLLEASQLLQHKLVITTFKEVNHLEFVEIVVNHFMVLGQTKIKYALIKKIDY